MKIDGSVVLVTGANRGIGDAFTRELLARGARKVYAGARDPSTVTRAGVQALRLDVTRPEDIAAAAAKASDVTLVINNAGIAQTGGLLADGSEEVARHIFETNFFGVLRMCKAFAPVLGANGGGALLNVLSVASWINGGQMGAYAASKSAAWSLTNAVRSELAAQKTQVLALHMGYVDTDLTRGFDVPKSSPDEIVKRALDGLEAGFDEVLADDVTLQVKGGMTASRPSYLPQTARDPDFITTSRRPHASRLPHLQPGTPMLFEPLATATSLRLANRIVMSPMTRSRAIDANTPNALMAEYYGQRASAGLIITEGTSPSPNGLGYARIPGLFNEAQVRGWKTVTDAVHAKGGKIFVQLMHTGRVTHVANLPAGAEVLGPMADACPGEIYTDAHGMQPHTAPRAMTASDIARTVEEYAQSARYAIDAGFDGIELHAANGYLIEQFLNANVNKRTDGYGGSADGRNRFTLEIARATVAAIGAHRVGIRLSPHGVFNSTGEFPGVATQYLALVRELSEMSLLYVHVLDHSAMGAPSVPADLKSQLRAAFDGLFILAGGFDRASAERALQAGQADLIAFGRPFLANPDLVVRMQSDAALNSPDPTTFYTPGQKGYTDYPMLAA